LQHQNSSNLGEIWGKNIRIDLIETAFKNMNWEQVISAGHRVEREIP